MQTRRYNPICIGVIAIVHTCLCICARSDTVFTGGSVTLVSSWDSGLPSSTNQGTVAVDGYISQDVRGFDVVQTGGTITVSLGFAGQRELRSTTWTLLGGEFRRSDSGLRIGGGSSAPSLFHVVDGTLSVTALNQPLIIHGGDSLLKISGGAVAASGSLKVDLYRGHGPGPFLEFGLGAGTASFSGLELGAAGYINFVSGSAGVLILTEGLITDNLYGAADTFWELWQAGRLRIDGLSDGAFNNRFLLTVTGATKSLKLKKTTDPDTKFVGAEHSGGAFHLTWDVTTNGWVIERSSTLLTRWELADHSTTVLTNHTAIPVSATSEFFRILTGLRVLSGFTDSNLVSAIKQIGLNELGPDSHVYDLDVVGLTSLRVDRAGIVTIGGVEEMPGILHLDLRDNPIADLAPVSAMNQLQGIALQGMSLEDTSILGSLTNLTWVGLSDNLITTLSGLSSLIGVTDFDLSGNLLTNLTALANVSHATSLDLANNGITNLAGIEAVAGLEYLNLQGNAVTDISVLSNLTALAWLDLSDNQVSNLVPLTGLTNLSWVGFSHNALTNTAGLSSAVQVKWLDLQDNLIEDLTGLSSLTNLTWLNLTSNSISALEDLTPLSRLRVLDVHSNEVSSLAGLEGLTGLHWVGVSENDISDLAPLIVNASMGGLGTGSVVYVGGNPLSNFAITNQISVLWNTYGVIVNQD